jgi:hypothetical protein
MQPKAMKREEFITIVSGLPRSGTSMMMQMLVAGGIPPQIDQVRQPDEDNPLGYFEFEPVKQQGDTSWIDGSRGKVVKMVYRLLYNLPQDHSYHVIFMMRNLDEVIASQQVMLRRRGNSGEDVEGPRLGELYRRQLHDALGWLRAQPNFAVLTVDHHDALFHPDLIANQLDRFLGGGLNRDAMAGVPNSSLYRQRSAVGERVMASAAAK